MNDLISRNALIKEIKNAEIPHGNIVGVVLAYIKTQPTIEAVEVVHGRLIRKGRISARCSECNYLTLETEANFCPNCGARMDLKES